jgi:hypothetical protein
MEPITTAIIGMFIWENLGQPILEKAKDEYAGQLLGKLESALKNIPFKKKDLEVLEAEIVTANDDVLSDKDKFLEYIQNNPKIQELITDINKREIINISVGKGIGYIETMHGDINF